MDPDGVSVGSVGTLMRPVFCRHLINQLTSNLDNQPAAVAPAVSCDLGHRIHHSEII